MKICRINFDHRSLEECYEEHMPSDGTASHAEELAEVHGYELPGEGCLNYRWAREHLSNTFNINAKSRVGRRVLDHAAYLVSLRGLAYGEAC